MYAEKIMEILASKKQDLPPEWIFTQLKDIVNIKYGKNLPVKYFIEDGKYPVFGANGLIGYYDKYIYENEQVLISCRGANSGAVNYSPPKCFITNNSLILELIAPNHIHSKILYYILQSVDRSQLVTGTAQPQVTIENTLPLTVPLPPLNEQKRIVAKLEKLLGKVNDCQERLEKIPTLLKRIRQSVLAAACSGRLTADWREKNPNVEPAEELLIKDQKDKSNELPKNWCFVSVGDVIKGIKYGTSKKCSYDKQSHPVLRIPNIIQGIIDRSDLKYTELSDKEYEKLKLIAGDLLMIRSNGSVSLVGQTAMVTKLEEGYTYAGYLIRLRPNSYLIDSSYLNFCLSSHEVRVQIELPARSTSGVNNINSTEVKKLAIRVPPLEEQKEIVKRVETLFKKCDLIEQRYQQAKAYTDKLTQSILAKAFRGELVPQNPNDEPASVLLEKIKAEKAEQEKKPKRKTTKKRSQK